MTDPKTAVEKLRMRGWLQTYTGSKFYPLNPKAEEISIFDIAHGLAMTCRYGGHSRAFYSVAEHCVHVSRLVESKYARQGLLHDSAEAYIGDMVRPLKHQPEMEVFRNVEARIEEKVFARFDITASARSNKAVKTVDNRILVDEINALMADPQMYLMHPSLQGVRGFGVSIHCWTPEVAEHMFMNRYSQLFKAEAE